MKDNQNILFVISHPDASTYLIGMGAAAIRKGIEFSLFFTGDGVAVLTNSDHGLQKTLDAANEAIACEHAWKNRQGKSNCPVVLGSQTDHSRMVGALNKVVSL